MYKLVAIQSKKTKDSGIYGTCGKKKAKREENKDSSTVIYLKNAIAFVIQTFGMVLI